MGLCKVLVVFLIAASAVDARSPLSPAATFFRRLQQASSPSPANVAVPPSVTSPSPSDAAEGDAAALQLLQQGSRNILSLQAAGLQGWSGPNNLTSINPCQGWTGVTCNSNNRVIALELGGWNIETRLPPELSLMTELVTLNLTGNNLVGGLPSNWGQSSAFQYLQVLDLSGNGNLEGGLPPTWGTQGAFPRLVVMNLSWTGVNGQLPAAWGSQQSFPQMTTLDLSNNILAGELPASWGTVGAFASLEQLNLNNNTFDGSLAPQWGSSLNGVILPSLQRLDVGSNRLSGTLPNTWGTGFNALSFLSLYDNSLAGGLPSEWAEEGRFLNLTYLDLHNNSLAGMVPDSWNQWSILPKLELILTPGNKLCSESLSAIQTALVSWDNSSMPSCMGPSPSPGQILSPVPGPSPLLSQNQTIALVSSPPPTSSQITPRPVSPPAPAPLGSPPISQPLQPPLYPAPLQLPALTSPSVAPTPAQYPLLRNNPPQQDSLPALPNHVPDPSPAPAEANLSNWSSVSPLSAHCLDSNCACPRAPQPLPKYAPTPAPSPAPGQAPSPILGSASQPMPGPAPAPDPSPPRISMAPVPASLDTLPGLGPVFSIPTVPIPSALAPAPAPVVLPGSMLAPAPGTEAIPSQMEVPSPAPAVGAAAPATAAAPAPVPAAAAPAPYLAGSLAAAAAPAPQPSSFPLVPSNEGVPMAAPAPAPGPDSAAQVMARYVMSGGGLDISNDTVRQILVSALNNTLQMGSGTPISLESFIARTSRRRVLALSNNAEATFLFNTTYGRAPELVQDLNSTATSMRYGEQLNSQGLPNVEPVLNATSINTPLINNPFAPNAAPGGMIPAISPIPVSPGSPSVSLSGGAIGGIVAGVVVAIVAALFLLCCFWRKRKRKSAESEESGKGTAELDTPGEKSPAAKNSLGGQSPIPVEAVATPEDEIEVEDPRASPGDRDTPQTTPKRQSPGLFSQAVQWRKRPASPKTPAQSPQREKSSRPHSEQAAKAARKYKSASEEHSGTPMPDALGSLQSIDVPFDPPGNAGAPIFRNPVIDTQSHNSALDSFEVSEGATIQTIPAYSVEDGGMVDQLPEIAESPSTSRSGIESEMPLPPLREQSTESIATMPIVSEDTGSSGESHPPSTAKGSGSGPGSAGPEASIDDSSSSDKPLDRKQINHSLLLHKGAQRPRSARYPRRTLGDPAYQHRTQGLSSIQRSARTVQVFDGHQKISKGGFVKRAVPDDQPPPPSYARRPAEENISKPADRGRRNGPHSRQGSAALSRNGSATLTPRSASMQRAASGGVRLGSGDLKSAGKQIQGILRHSDETPRPGSAHDGLPSRSAFRPDSLLAVKSGGMTRSGSLQRVVSFEDEKAAREEAMQQGSEDDRTSPLSRLWSSHSRDLPTVRELPSSSGSSRPFSEADGSKPATTGPPQPLLRNRSPSFMPSPKRFVRPCGQEPKSRVQPPEPGKPASAGALSHTVKPVSRQMSAQLPAGYKGSTDVQPGSRSRNEKLELRRSSSARDPIDEREEKWEKEAARLKALEQHMRNAITPKGKPESTARRHIEGAKSGSLTKGAKPSLEEMLVLIEDARKLYPPGSDTRTKLDQRAEEFSARLEAERSRKASKREKSDSEIQPI